MAKRKGPTGRALIATCFRLSSAELEAVAVAAESELRSPSSWIRLAVQEKLERDGHGKV